MQLHYFTFESRIAAVEDAEQAAKYEQAGWQKATPAEFRVAWRQRDMARYAAMWDELAWRRIRPLEREVRVPGLPYGFVRHWV